MALRIIISIIFSLFALFSSLIKITNCFMPREFRIIYIVISISSFGTLIKSFYMFSKILIG